MSLLTRLMNALKAAYAAAKKRIKALGGGGSGEEPPEKPK